MAKRIVLLHPSAAEATSGAGSAVDVDAFRELRVQLDVSTASGTSPTLDVVVEDTVDGENWNEVGGFVQATGATREVIDITTLFSGKVRASWTAGGTTPSFTFDVRAVAIP